jgi:hypothetical protein
MQCYCLNMHGLNYDPVNFTLLTTGISWALNFSSSGAALTFSYQLAGCHGQFAHGRRNPLPQEYIVLTVLLRTTLAPVWSVPPHPQLPSIIPVTHWGPVKVRSLSCLTPVLFPPPLCSTVAAPLFYYWPLSHLTFTPFPIGLPKFTWTDQFLYNQLSFHARLIHHPDDGGSTHL